MMIEFIQKYGKVLYLAAGMVLIWLAWTISGSVISARFEKKLAEAQKTAEAKAQEAIVKVSEAQTAHDQADGLKIELAARDKEIASLNDELSSARARTARTRTIYVQTKASSQPSIPLSGDNAVDRVRVCSGLGEVGIACR